MDFDEMFEEARKVLNNKGLQSINTDRVRISNLENTLNAAERQLRDLKKRNNRLNLINKELKTEIETLKKDTSVNSYLANVLEMEIL